jgi:Rod binding domain-containing protein
MMMAANEIPMKISVPGGSGEKTPTPRLVRAAHEFEGQMMKELLKPMTEGGLVVGGGNENGSAGSGGTLGEFASEALGQALSERGGFGIANSIVRELSHPGTQHGIGKVTRVLHRDTVIRALE